MNSRLSISLALLLATSFCIPARATDLAGAEVNFATVLADIFIVRPAAMAWLVGSAPVTAAIAMPVAAMSGNSKRVSEVMLSTPFWHAFKRPLGDFSSSHDW
jgi:hypothetical protein